MNLDEVVAIDVHTHVLASVDDPAAAPTDGNTAMAKYFGADVKLPTIRDLAVVYRGQSMMCVAFCVDTGTATGRPPRVTNDEIVDVSAEYPDTIIPFGSVDPHTGNKAK